VKAMVLEAAGEPLRLVERPRPEPAPGQVLIRVGACGVCRTDLHIVDGELDEPSLPLVLGHQIVGRVESLGENAGAGLAVGDRVGVPWLGGSCGDCSYCGSERENLCDRARFTGYQQDGGFAEYAVADARYCIRIATQTPTSTSTPTPTLRASDQTDVETAPLLCAGLIGYRSLRMAGDARRLGLYGFGASAHIVLQVARHQGREVYAFTRPGDGEGQDFARGLGACWAGGSDESPPEPLDAAIVFAPVGALVPTALRALAKGGVVVCAGIHMSDIPSFPYADLWGERVIRSVANLTRADGREFFEVAPRVPVRTQVESFPLERANEALEALRQGRVRGAAVLQIS
jgi:propanol-preferring alcohol dehydrogenase